MPKQRGPGWLFHVTALASGVFVLTVMAMVAVTFGDPAAPLNLWLNQHAGQLLAGEVGLIVVSACAAMGWDQWRTARDQSRMRE